MTTESKEEWTTTEPWVYGVVYGSLVFAPERVAVALAEDIELGLSAETVGQARAVSESLQISWIWLPDEDDEVEDDESYDVTIIEDYPPRLATYALDHWSDWEDDLDDLADVLDGFPGVPTLQIDPQQQETAVERLTSLGYQLRLDQGLLSRTEI